MLKARILFLTLICASPAMLLWNGLLVQGAIAGIVAITLAIIAQTLPPGETDFLVSTIRSIAIFATIPALWVLIQVLPLMALAHPIWASVEIALAHPVIGTISLDPGASVVAFGQYISLAAAALVSAAVAVDRQRAEWILFALTVATGVIALILLVDEFVHFGSGLTPSQKAQALDCAALGMIIATAACIRTVERYETRYAKPWRSRPVLIRTFLASSVALALCAAALLFDMTREVWIATGYGIVAFACILIIRRFRIGAWYASTIAAATIGVGIILIAAHQPERSKSPLLAFAASPTAVSERVLEDAPLVGTGAGTFAGLATIYREMGDSDSRSVPPTTAAALAIELGLPMLWLIVFGTSGLIIMLLRASLRRRRDSFYPAMGGSCLISVMVLSLVNTRLSAAPTGLIVAAALGLAIAQSKSRTVQA